MASNTYCNICLGSRNEINFCQMLKATKVAKFFMFPPLGSLVLEPDLDTGRNERAQKWAADKEGTAHIQLIFLLIKWPHQNQRLNLKENMGFDTTPFAFCITHWDLCTIITATFLSQNHSCYWAFGFVSLKTFYKNYISFEVVAEPCFCSNGLGPFPSLWKDSRTVCSRSSRDLLGK